METIENWHFDVGQHEIDLAAAAGGLDSPLVVGQRLLASGERDVLEAPLLEVCLDRYQIEGDVIHDHDGDLTVTSALALQLAVWSHERREATAVLLAVIIVVASWFFELIL